jgi:branched-chain amino acid aminotransferase
MLSAWPGPSRGFETSQSSESLMNQCVMIDGRLHPLETARVSVYDRGFLYGDSVFETVRTYGGAPFRLDAHLERLGQSAERVLIPLPVPLSVLSEEVQETVRAAGNPESYIRLMLTRGQGAIGLAPVGDLHPLRVIIVGPLEPPPPEAYVQGIGVVTYRTQRATDATDAAGAKVANYLVSVLGLIQARRRGASEAIVVDAHGSVAEGSTSNVFAVIGGHLVTPPEEAGILAGITRACVLEVARQLGVTVELRRLPLDELFGAEEAFISSSIRELLPVVTVDGRTIGAGHPGTMTRRLLEAFRQWVRAEMAGQARTLGHPV